MHRLQHVGAPGIPRGPQDNDGMVLSLGALYLSGQRSKKALKTRGQIKEMEGSPNDSVFKKEADGRSVREKLREEEKWGGRCPPNSPFAPRLDPPASF